MILTHINRILPLLLLRASNIAHPRSKATVAATATKTIDDRPRTAELSSLLRYVLTPPSDQCSLVTVV